MEALQHAAKGALACGGGLTATQSLLARRLQPPSSFALSVSSFVGTFRLIESLGRRREADVKRHVPSIAAASAGAVALVFLDAKRKGLLISYAAMEAAIALASEFTTLAEINHIEMPLAALALHRVIYIWIYQSHLFTKAQLGTLDGFSRLSEDVLRRMRTEIPANLTKSRCDVFHRGQTCVQFNRSVVTRNFTEAMKLYVPIYFISSGLLRYKRWLWGPRPSVPSLITQYLRTCMCLTSLYAIPLACSCIFPLRNNRVAISVSGALTASCLWTETESRRISVLKAISAYPIAGTATYLAQHLQLTKRSIQLWQYVIFSVALGVIFRRPQTQSGKVMQLLYGHEAPVTQELTAKAENDDDRDHRESEANDQDRVDVVDY